MLKSLFFGYLSPAWKRLVRTIAVLNCLFYLLAIFEDVDAIAIVPSLIIANALLSYTFELFVKKNQKIQTRVNETQIFNLLCKEYENKI
jgi:hypothetical protein|tara:strand:- start:32 stop:298 length:267 start_codon:yes stop_codon:yes gene_type:complete